MTSPHRVIFTSPPESAEHRRAFWVIVAVNGSLAMLAGIGIWLWQGAPQAVVAALLFTVLLAVVMRFFLWSWWGR